MESPASPLFIITANRQQHHLTAACRPRPLHAPPPPNAERPDGGEPSSLGEETPNESRAENTSDDSKPYHCGNFPVQAPRSPARLGCTHGFRPPGIASSFSSGKSLL
jgi:hypothetical protein